MGAIQLGRTLSALLPGEPEAGGPYQLQVAIAACHASVSRAEHTDWMRIAALDRHAEVTARGG